MGYIQAVSGSDGDFVIPGGLMRSMFGCGMLFLAVVALAVLTIAGQPILGFVAFMLSIGVLTRLVKLSLSENILAAFMKIDQANMRTIEQRRDDDAD